MINILKKALIPLLLIVLFLLDGIFSQIFSPFLHTADYYMTPRLIVIFLAVLAFFFPRVQIIVYAIIFGLFYDVFYTNILGVYVVLFPTIVYINEKMRNLLNQSAIVIGMMLIINLTLLEFSLYVFYRTLRYTSIDITQFLTYRLGPTLMLNLVLFILIYYPIRKLIQKVLEDSSRNYIK